MRAKKTRTLGWVLLSSALVTAAAACKSNSIDNQTTNNSVGSNVIGPQGGIVLGPEGSSVRIAAGALTKDTAITVRVADAGQYPPQPSSYNFASKVFSFEPHGLLFNSPAVITIPMNAGASTNGLVALHADPNGTWMQMQAQPGIDSAQISTPSFSFYALGTSGSQNPAESNQCSGRGPDNSAPTGTLSGLSGSIDQRGQTGSTVAIPLSSMVDAYASSTQTGMLTITLTNYAKACGFVKNRVLKIGSTSTFITVRDPSNNPITTRTYTVDESSVGATSVPASAQAGPCSAGGSDGASGPPGNANPAVTITAIDSTHVAGSFDFIPNGQTSRIQGTFSVPICPDTSSLTSCCVP